jgi:glycolate oxidase
MHRSFVAEIRKRLGADRVLSEAIEMFVFGKDAGITRGTPLVVVFPASTDQVVAAVRTANAHGVPIVARGAGTGLAGGAVATGPSMLLVLTEMNEIERIDEDDRTAWVGPGVINLDLTAATRNHGLHFAPDPSSQSACTIGGNIACNSGGPHCLAEGSTANHVLALEVVLADGEIVVLGGSSPDPIGLDLRAVMVGSEGTMGVVTRALVKLTPDPPAVRTLLLAFDSVADAAATVSDVIAHGLVPAALEMMDRLMTVAVERFVNAGFPTDAAAVLIAEVAGHESGVGAEAQLIQSVAADHGATLIRVAADEAEREKIWLGRKSAFGAIAQMNPDYYLHDIVVPRTRLVEAMERVYEISDRHQMPMLNVFHAGDGNLHPLMSFDSSEPGMLERVEAVSAELMQVCVDVGGSLSGEHGIGLEKRDHMPLVFSEVDLDAQARLREAFDPQGRLNPDKVLPAGSRCFDFGRQPPAGAWI